MAKPASKNPQAASREKTAVFPLDFPMQPFFNGNSQSIEAWTRMSQSILAGLGALQSHTAQFVAKRLEEDMARQREIATCRSPVEAMEICNAFTRQAMQDYLEGASRVSDIAADMTEACTQFGESITRTAADTMGEAEPVVSMTTPTRVPASQTVVAA